MKNNLNTNKVILILVILLMFLPYSINVLGISLVKISTILIGLIFFYFCIVNKEEIKNILKNKFILLNIVFSLAIGISLIVNYKTIQINDIYEIIKYLVFAMISIIIIIIICKNDKNYLFLLRTISILLIIVCIFGIIQYFNPFSINELYVKSYAPTQYESLVNDYPNPRIVGVKSNPSVYGFLMALGVYFNLLYIKFTNKKGLAIISIILCITNLMLTLTRTIQIAFICSTIIYIVVNVWIKKGWKKALLAMFGALLGILIILSILPKELTWRLIQVLDMSNATSWIGRTEKWIIYMEIIKQNLLIGIGPVKNMVEEIGYIDSELIQNLLQYGIIGFGTYIAMLLSPLCIYIKNKNYENILRFYPSILSIILINNMANTSLILYETAIGIYIMLGLLFIDNKIEKVKEDIN